MCVALLLCIVTLYAIEVVFGSCSEVYNAELGGDANWGQGTRLTNKDFFLQELPMILCSVGFLFLIFQV